MSIIKDKYFSLSKEDVLRCKKDGVDSENVEAICSRIGKSFLMLHWFSPEVYNILLRISTC